MGDGLKRAIAATEKTRIKKPRTRICLWRNQRVRVIGHKRGSPGWNDEHPDANGIRCKGSMLAPIPRGHE